MQTTKKTVAWVFGFALLAVVIVLFPMLTKAEQYGDYEYTFLTNITIPISVKSIEESAFNYCSDLSDVNYAGLNTDKDKIEIDDNGNYYLLEAA